MLSCSNKQVGRGEEVFSQMNFVVPVVLFVSILRSWFNPWGWGLLSFVFVVVVGAAGTSREARDSRVPGSGCHGAERRLQAASGPVGTAPLPSSAAASASPSAPAAVILSLRV